MGSADMPRAPMPPHFVYRSLLEKADHRALLEWALRSEHLLRPSTLVEGKVREAIRQSRSLPLTGLHGPWRELLTAAIERLMPDLFAGAGLKPFPVSSIEFELVAYGDGALFQPHQDTIRSDGERRSDRLLTAIYYFFAEPRAFTGGALRLHRFGTVGDAPGDHVDIEPEQNSLLVFPAWATHEVTPVRSPGGDYRGSRFAINCWLHRARA